MRWVAGILVFIPAGVFVGVFTTENSEPLGLRVWPFPGMLELSTSVWILLLLAIGLIAGMTIGWLSGGKYRRQARRSARRLRRLERELDQMSEKQSVAGVVLDRGADTSAKGRS